MRVLFVIEGLGTGGAERSLAESLPGLVERGIRPSIAHLYRRPQGVEESLRRGGYETRLLSGPGLIGKSAALRALLRRLRPHLVHTTLFRADLVGRLAAVGAEPIVIGSLVNTSYDPVRLLDPRVRRGRLAAARMVDGWTARHLTEHFHSISRAVKDSAVRHLGIPPERITVIERGRDPARLGEPGPERRRAARRRLGVGPHQPLLVTVGRQEYQKGHAHLLEAVPRLGRFGDLVVLVAGRPGAATQDLLRLADRLRLGDRVRLLGHRDDVPDLLAAADLFVFPSLYEGFGGAVIEAMALQLPVVASDLPALREVVEPEGTGLLVPPADPEALARAVARLLDGPARAAEMGRRGRRLFLARFTIERSVERLARLYRDLVG